MGRKFGVVALAFVALVVTVSCQTGVKMWSSCTPSADRDRTGTDGRYVLVCNDGKWRPLMMVDEFVRAGRGEKFTIAEVPTEPPAQVAATTTTTTTSTTTTVAPDPWAQYEGQCFPNVLNPGYNDLKYNGPINTLDNAVLYLQFGQPCTVPVAPDYPSPTRTVVSAPDLASATPLCQALGLTVAYQPNAFIGWPADGWFCYTP